MDLSIAIALHWLTTLYASILLLILLTTALCLTRITYRIIATDLIRDEWERTIYRTRRSIRHIQSLHFRLRFCFRPNKHPRDRRDQPREQRQKQRRAQVQKQTHIRQASVQ